MLGGHFVHRIGFPFILLETPLVFADAHQDVSGPLVPSDGDAFAAGGVKNITKLLLQIG